MSNEESKIKNSRRRQTDENAIKKQTKIARHHKLTEYEQEEIKQPHRFNKHHAMDCGNTECYLCGNPRKTHKDKLTVQEKRFLQDLDQVRDRHSNGLNDKKEE
jgi:hypothetical protein